jgi:hypothetical protein
MNKFLSKLLIIALLISQVPAFLIDVPVAKAVLQTAGGDGSVSDPYMISNCEQLQSIRSTETDYINVNFVLTQDIDCSLTNPNTPGFTNMGTWGNQTGFNPIGGYGGAPVFDGNFDGRGYVISGLYINKTTDDLVGLFGEASGVIKNVTISEADVRGDETTGIVVGKVSSNNNSLLNISVINSTVTGLNYVGAIAGWVINDNSVEDSPLVSRVSANNTVVSGFANTGGLIGITIGNITVQNTFFDGSIFATSPFGENFGGLIGQSQKFANNDALLISDSYATGTIAKLQSNPAEYFLANVGGLVGRLEYNNSVIEDTLADVTITDSPNNRANVIGLITNTETMPGNFLNTVYYSNANNPAFECVNGFDLPNNFLACKSVENDLELGDISGLYNTSNFSPFSGWDFDDIWQLTPGLPSLVAPSFLRVTTPVPTPTALVNPTITLNAPFAGELVSADIESRCLYSPTSLVQGDNVIELSYQGDGAQPFPNGTYNNCVVQLQGLNESTEILNLPSFTIGLPTLDGVLVPEETGTTSENVVGFQLSFNNRLNTYPEIEDFTVVNGFVNSVTSFDANGKDFWIQVVPSGDDVEISLTLNEDTVNDLDLNSNAQIGPVTIDFQSTPFSGQGEGTSDSPYLITSCAQLQEMQKDLDAEYKLTQDIDCTASRTWNLNPTEFDDEDTLIPDELDNVTNNGYRGFNPVGNSLTPFTGKLDGDGYEISNLWIFRKYNNYVGIFGFAEDADVIDLDVVDSDVVGGGSTGTIFGQAIDVAVTNVNVSEAMTRAYRSFYGGGLIGALISESGDAIVASSSYQGAVHGTGNVIGGIVGQMNGGTFYYVTADISVDGGLDIGGIVGQMNGGAIYSSTATGNVILQRDDIYTKPGINAGGFVGSMSGNSQILSSDAAVDVSIEGEDVAATQAAMGGFVGNLYDSGSTIVFSSATGDVTGESERIGGFAGAINGNNSVSRSFSTGNVSGVAEIGGFVGYLGNSTLSNVYSTSTVTGTGQSIGGLVGYSDTSIIENAYSSGTVTGVDLTGGLIGTMSSGTLRHTFSVSPVVSNGTNVGALIGDSGFEISTLSYNYFDPLISGLENCSNEGNLVNDCIGMEEYNLFDEGNLPFTLMETAVWNDPDSQFLTWDFEPDAYPVLFPLEPTLETLEATVNDNQTVTLRGKVLSANFEQLLLFFLADTSEGVYFNFPGEGGFSGIPIGPIFGPNTEIEGPIEQGLGAFFDPETLEFEYTVNLVNADQEIIPENTLLCDQTYYYLSLGTNGFGNYFFGVSRNVESFTTPQCEADNATQAPTLTSPATSSSYDLNASMPITFTLPETMFANSLSLTFTPIDGDPIIVNLRDANSEIENTFNLNLQNLTESIEVTSASASMIPAGVYSVTLSYQDVLGNSPASVTNTTVSIGQEAAPRSGGGGSGSKSSTRSNSETASSNYAQEVKAVIDAKVVTENPDSLTNKCEALVMMERVFEWEVPVSSGTKYSDVPEWCTNVAAFGTTRGIVEGRTPTTLGMETPVTRDEVALMIYRELKLQKYEFKGSRQVTFTDMPLTPWAAEAIQMLAKEGIINGFADGTFGGKKNILKQDLAIMLYRHKKANKDYSKVDDSSKI